MSTPPHPPPRHHVTQDDVSAPLQRLEVERMTGHQSVRGRGGVIAVMDEAHWAGFSRPPWEREMDLQLSRQPILLNWAGTPNQHRQTNHLYRQMRIGAAQRELSRANGERFLAPGYGCVPRTVWFRHHSSTVLPNGAHLWYKVVDGLWWLGKISVRTTTDGENLVRFLDDPGPIKLPISPAHYTTSTGGVQGSWCLQLRRGKSVARGTQGNVD